MSSYRYEARAIRPREGKWLNDSVKVIERVNRARVVALLFVGQDTVPFVQFKPGFEKEVASILEKLDWRAIRLLVEEHL